MLKKKRENCLAILAGSNLFLCLLYSENRSHLSCARESSKATRSCKYVQASLKLADYLKNFFLPLSTVVCFTSGTCGIPRGVLLTHANLVANVSAVLLEMVSFFLFSFFSVCVCKYSYFLSLSHSLCRISTSI